ncbi:MAG TPA: alpha-glucan family phosphorylase [Candidatus Tectomicrobia bacterium]|nr:alpha-glucan family phosphorylase [Candidatus Tectomicrobia bacterium]
MFKITDTIAYFTMEIGLDTAIPTYSGGLGVLAGDTLRAVADLGLPMVAVTLLHRKGYFRQHLDAAGDQSESPVAWVPEEVLEPLSPRVIVTIEGRSVLVGAWRYLVRGVFGYTVPVYFLDTAIEGNSPWDHTITDRLYGGDSYYRLCQEVVLGLGGAMMLRALGFDRIQPYHMNEGHAALLTLALLEQQTAGSGWQALTEEDVEAVRQRCVFTTHTPVPAGHDRFPLDLVRQVLGKGWTAFLEKANCCLSGTLDMTYLALYFSRYVNGVAMRHRDVSRGMFPHYPIDAITNGVHAVTWAAIPFRNLYDHHIPEWRHDNFYLRYAVKIPLYDIQYAHTQTKQGLLELVQQRTSVRMDEAVLTIGFARRAAAYKRADLLFSDLERLRWMTRHVGPLQVIYAGKAHPQDAAGKALIRRIFVAATRVGESMQTAYLENYDMGLAREICAGVDLWLNTPQRPQEASGTSGMKAALNGVPSLSVLDGWWLEGHQEGVTGWAIGDEQTSAEDPCREVASLYDKLEHVILPMFYRQPTAYAQVMRSTIALNGSFFNAQRMVLQYLRNAYFGVES